MAPCQQVLTVGGRGPSGCHRREIASISRAIGSIALTSSSMIRCTVAHDSRLWRDAAIPVPSGLSA